MRHLITGGAGFIGSHLCEWLLARGDTVVALDDLSTGLRGNVEHLFATGRFTLVEGSILDPSVVETLVAAADDVYHLAAAVGVRRVVTHPVEALVTNTIGTKNVVQAAAKLHRPLLLTSSSEVYGTSDAVPFHEDAGVTLGATNRSRWGYGCSKALDEFLALAYAQEQGLAVVIVRLFNTVGPRQSWRYGMVIPRFVRQALAGEPLTVYGDGTQTRCFTWVGDIVAALPRLLAESRAHGMIVNLGSDEEISMLDLARRVIARTGSVSEVRLVPFVEAYGPGFDDLRRRIPSLERARTLVGFRPTVGIDAILDRIVAHERNGRESKRVVPLALVAS